MKPAELQGVFIAAGQAVLAEAMKAAKAAAGPDAWAQWRAGFDGGRATGSLQLAFTADGKACISASLVGTWQGRAKAIEIHTFEPQDSMELMARLWNVPWQSAALDQ